MSVLAQGAAAGRSRAGRYIDVHPAPPDPEPPTQAKRQPRPALPLPDAGRPWDPWTKTKMQNALDAGAFGALGKFERLILRQLIHHRNPETLRCDPTMGRLALETECSIRRVSGAIKTLRAEPQEPTEEDPSRGGHGLIARRRRRHAGNQTSNLYWFSPRFYELFESYEQAPRGASYKVRPDGTACHQQTARDAISSRHAVPSNETLSSQETGSDPDPSSSLPRPILNKKGSEPREDAREEPRSPLILEVSPGELRALGDFATFAGIFDAARRDKYGGEMQGAVMPQADRAELGRYLRSLTGRACTAAEERDRPADPADVFAALSAELVGAWLAHPGGNGFLERACHPLPRLFEDVARFGEDALSRWLERLPPRPPLPDLRDLLPHAVGLQGDERLEPDGWPDAWDDAEPSLGELEPDGGAWGAAGEAEDAEPSPEELEPDPDALAVPPGALEASPHIDRRASPLRATSPRRPLGAAMRGRHPVAEPQPPEEPTEIAAAIAELQAIIARRDGPPGMRRTGRR